jgi:S-DNA-T family DNA segregation ATPase FtsK/SpoIIIE
MRASDVKWCGVIAPPKSSLGERVPGAVALRTAEDVRLAINTLPPDAISALFIEDAAGLVGDDREDLALTLVREVEKRGGFVVAESETSSWTQYSDLLKLLRSHRTGLLVQPDQEDGSALLRTDLPRCRRRDFAVCGGMYVRAGAAVKAQFAEPD